MYEFDELIKPYFTETKEGILWEYFEIALPDDLFHTPKENLDYSIYIVRETCDTFRIPCEWEANYNGNSTYVVIRRSKK